MHQNAFGGRAAPEPAAGACSTPPEGPDPLAELRGREWEKGGGRKGMGDGLRGSEGEKERGGPTPIV